MAAEGLSTTITRRPAASTRRRRQQPRCTSTSAILLRTSAYCDVYDAASTTTHYDCLPHISAKTKMQDAASTNQDATWLQAATTLQDATNNFQDATTKNRGATSGQSIFQEFSTRCDATASSVSSAQRHKTNALASVAGAPPKTRVFRINGLRPPMGGRVRKRANTIKTTSVKTRVWRPSGVQSRPVARNVTTTGKNNAATTMAYNKNLNVRTLSSLPRIGTMLKTCSGLLN